MQNRLIRLASPGVLLGLLMLLAACGGPTQDQAKYLSDIQRKSAPYDPKVVVGGPRRTRF